MSFKSIFVLIMSTFICSCQTPLDELALQSIDKDISMGQEVREEIRNDSGFIENTLSTSYVQALGRHLVQQLPERRFHFEFYLLDQEEPNAFAAPGGYVFVSRGLLALCQSEDELAQVIGHEIFHVRRRHTARQQARSILPKLLTLPGRAVGGLLSPRLGNLINLPIAGLGGSYIAAFSRSHETEADELGQELVTGIGGYQPEAMAAILARIEKYSHLHGQGASGFSFFNTHPLTEDRVENLEKKARSIQVARKSFLSESKEGFLKNLQGLLIGENPAKGIFRAERFFHPDLGIVVDMPEKWQFANSSSAVMALEPAGKGMVAFQIAGEKKQAHNTAIELQQILQKQLALPLAAVVDLEVNGLQASRISYDFKSEGVKLDFIFIEHGHYLFLAIVLADDDVLEVSRRSAISFRQLNDKERESILVKRMHFRSAKKGESLSEFQTRTGCTWSLKESALMNALGESSVLSGRESLKVALEEKYKTAKGN